MTSCKNNSKVLIPLRTSLNYVIVIMLRTQSLNQHCDIILNIDFTVRHSEIVIPLGAPPAKQKTIVDVGKGRYFLYVFLHLAMLGPTHVQNLSKIDQTTMKFEALGGSGAYC
jgi:hypothetical protein